MSILTIVIKYLIILENIDSNIQCERGYAYSSIKQKMCTWVNEGSWKMLKLFFPDEKKIKKCPKITV